MKKTILTAAILLTASAAAFAQSSLTPVTPALKVADDAKLQVVLKSIQTIEVSSKPVVLTYKTKEDYMSGVSSTEDKHLKIFSTGGFAVSVLAKGDLVGNTGKTIESKSISVKLGPATTNSIPVLTSKNEVSLTHTAQPFFSNVKGGSNETFSVVYQGAGDGVYLNNFNKDQSNIYETFVTYSIEAI